MFSKFWNESIQKYFFSSKKANYVSGLLIFAFVIFGLIRFYYYLSDDFRLSNITIGELSFKPSWEALPIQEEERCTLSEIFAQPFSYIGKGAQSYAFVSQDQRYVLKFFKFKHLKPNPLVEILPDFSLFKSFKQKYKERKERKLIGVFDGYALAYREDRENAHLIYIHLVPTNYLHLQATVYDKMGFKRTIALDDVVFLIQEKGETLQVRLNHLLSEGRVEEVKKNLSRILMMYLSEYKKGIYDHDHSVLQNTGFIREQPFHLDLGKLNQDERMKEISFYKEDLGQVIWKIDRWLEKKYPNYYPELSTFLADQYVSITGESLESQTEDPKIISKKRKWLGL